MGRLRTNPASGRMLGLNQEPLDYNTSVLNHNFPISLLATQHPIQGSIVEREIESTGGKIILSELDGFIQGLLIISQANSTLN